jgi:NAD(P)-dependent dehydrogenase (short-subunit alcohol dehydrogenase family)
MARLEGKVAIVTGGGSGFGEASCKLFAKEGAKVVVADWKPEGGERVAQEIKDAGGEATFAKTDVSKSADIQRMVKTAVDNYGKLDILFNNAGMQWGPDGPISYDVHSYPEEEAEQVIDINFKGNFLGMKYAIPEMLKNKGGSIISTASSCVFSACQGHAVYAGTKGGIYSLARSVAVEYAKKGIRCNTIGPGPGRTPFHTEYIELHPHGWKTIVNAIPMKRAAEPEDVAWAALFFASDESKYITGQNLMVDGGYTCGGFPIPMTDE